MPVPIISVAQMREWEQASWAAGCVESEVIERVGKAVAKRALQLTKIGDCILLLAGKGHNGDDVRAARVRLSGREVALIEVKDPAESMPILTEALATKPKLIVDGLFGIGLNRPLDVGWRNFIQAVNQARIPVLAVDVPSGLEAQTGVALGAAIEATVTLTVGAPKQGLLQPAAAGHVGRLEVAMDVGLIPCPLKADLHWTQPEDFEQYPPRRAITGHKGTYGHLAIVAGSTGYHGAAVLAARGALRAMPGLVSVLTPESVYGPVAGQLAAPMVHPLRLDHPLLENCDTLLVGPGLASPELPAQLKERVREWWKASPQAMVVDASALDWLPTGEVKPGVLRVITPHPGEAARMLGTTTAEVQANRLMALRNLSTRFGGCWVVLKGHHTLVGRSTGAVHVNGSGNAGLGQGGSGDVLGGYLAGLLAQGELRCTEEKTIRYAVWEHGAMADVLAIRQAAWTMEDLLTGLGNSRTP